MVQSTVDRILASSTVWLKQACGGDVLRRVKMSTATNLDYMFPSKGYFDNWIVLFESVLFPTAPYWHLPCEAPSSALDWAYVLRSLLAKVRATRG